MKLQTFWVVCQRQEKDASSETNCVWETDVDEFARYVLGTGLSRFLQEKHAIHADRESAMIDWTGRNKKEVRP